MGERNVRADAVLRAPDDGLLLMLEVDRGTEPVSRGAGKLASCAAFYAAGCAAGTSRTKAACCAYCAESATAPACAHACAVDVARGEESCPQP
jgi:hypothetical protein